MIKSTRFSLSLLWGEPGNKKPPISCSCGLVVHSCGGSRPVIYYRGRPYLSMFWLLLIRMPTDVTIQLGIRIRSVYIACISMTFELTSNTCALLLIGVASTFGMVKDSQTCATSVTKCEKNGKANNERVPKVLNSSPNARILLFLETATLGSLSLLPCLHQSPS